jgi:hypothetical protein
LYYSRSDIDRISGITDVNYMIQNIIQEKCRKLNTLIGCYDWEDNKQNEKFKTLVLYSSTGIYKFNIHKKFVADISKFEKKLIKLIRKTAKD